VAQHPRFRLNGDGSLWLLWTERQQVKIARYRSGEWSTPESLRAMHPAGETFWSSWCDLTRDRAERPALAWGDRGYGRTMRDVICVSVPDSTGWPPGEEVPGSDGAVVPSVARDRYGDIWVKWSLERSGGIYYAHTYVSVTATRPDVTTRDGRPHLRWHLSAPAPGSVWSVLRAGGDGEFRPAGQVRAAADTSLEWTDGEASQGRSVRYRLRRESLDARYQWSTDECRWSAGAGAARHPGN
jgi:hypothetical protein